MTTLFSPSRLMLAFAIAVALQGCALLGKNDPLVPRYFTVDVDSASTASGSGAGELRLGHIIGSDHLRERIAYRDQSGELGYREGLRWTERPEEYLRRALASELFEQRGIARVLSGAGPTLNIELVAFEEVRDTRNQPVARIQMVAVLQDGRIARLQQTFTVDEPVTSDDASKQGGADAGAPHALVRALSRALARAVDEVGDAIANRLTIAPSTTPVASASTAPTP